MIGNEKQAELKWLLQKYPAGKLVQKSARDIGQGLREFRIT